MASIHSRVFGQLFPGQAAVFRANEAIFGRRAGLPPSEIQTAFSNVVHRFSEGLRELGSLRDEALTDAAFLAAATTHAEMIRIHPFFDGNGRWARIVTSIFLCDVGFHAGTIIPARRKLEYIAACDRAIDHGECGDLAAVLLDGYIEQAQKRTGVSPEANRRTGR